MADAPASPPTESPSTSAPAVETPSSPADTPAAEPELFAGLGEDFDDVEVTIPEVQTEAAEPPTEAKPAEPPAAAAKPPAQPEAAKPEPPKPVTPQAPEGQQAQTEAPSPPPAGPQGLAEQLDQHRGEILDELSKTRFAWEPGEEKAFRAALEEDATQALVQWAPKMMSRMYYESATMALKHINQFVPTLIQNYLNLAEKQKAAEEQFFKQFPVLNKQAHWNDILTFAKSFGAQRGISQEDLLAMVGAAVMAKHKLTGVAAAANGSAPPRKPTAVPFVPAQAGAPAGAKVTTEPESPYGGLGQDFDD